MKTLSQFTKEWYNRDSNVIINSWFSSHALKGPQLMVDSMRAKLTRIYGEAQAGTTYQRLMALVQAHQQTNPPTVKTVTANTLQLTERDSILITYGDMLYAKDMPPLAALHRFLQAYAAPIVPAVHILPFYPYSSDDGFSVIDYRAVNPELGTWDDIRRIDQDFRLMFDAVFNHISAQSGWFQAFLRDEAPYRNYFTVVDPEVDLSMVVRPRTLPLLTSVETPSGTKHVWTTFSADQIDLNYANPDVLVALVDILLFYVTQGASLIRLDAIAFIWKELGTSCIHHEKAHLLIQVMREALDLAAPGTILISETNVPHTENISYFGDGYNEAQMVYQFPLPPLVLHTMTQGSAEVLSQWADTLQTPSDNTTFFNFTGSHDGIGLRPVSGLISDDEVSALVQRTIDHGGAVSFRTQSNGAESPYELNINYFDAITHPDITTTDPDTAVKRFMVSQAIPLALAGIPGIYFHSLFGSRSDHAGMARTGHKRSINREKLDATALTAELEQTGTLRQRVYSAYRRLLEIRTTQPAFHPLAPQRILDLGAQAFAVERTSRDGSAQVLALHNVTGQAHTVKLPHQGPWYDHLSSTPFNGPQAVLAPYQVLWLWRRL